MNTSFLHETSEIVTYFAFFELMLAATETGFHLGRKSEDSTPDKTNSYVTTVEAGILGVLGLLLGFTVSMAVSRFEARKQLSSLLATFEGHQDCFHSMASKFSSEVSG